MTDTTNNNEAIPLLNAPAGEPVTPVSPTPGDKPTRKPSTIVAGMLDKLKKPDRPLNPLKKFEHGRYAATKSNAQAATNVALITSNAAQLKSCFDKGPGVQKYFYFFVLVLIVSIAVQIVVGFVLVYLGSRESKLSDVADKGSKKTKRISRYCTMGNVFISIINVIMNAFAAKIGA